MAPSYTATIPLPLELGEISQELKSLSALIFPSVDSSTRAAVLKEELNRPESDLSALREMVTEKQRILAGLPVTTQYLSALVARRASPKESTSNPLVFGINFPLELDNDLQRPRLVILAKENQEIENLLVPFNRNGEAPPEELKQRYLRATQERESFITSLELGQAHYDHIERVFLCGRDPNNTLQQGLFGSIRERLNSIGDTICAEQQRIIVENEPRLGPMAANLARNADEFLEYVQEGRMAIAMSALRHNPALGPFSHFMVSYAHGMMLTKRYQGGMPGGYDLGWRQVAALKQIVQFEEQFLHTHHRDPTVEEISAFVGKETGEVHQILDMGRKFSPLDREVEHADHATSKLVTEIDESVRHPSEVRFIGEYLEILREHLSPYEVEVISLHLGLKDGIEYTFQEMVSRYSVGAAALSLTYNKAIRKIRAIADEIGLAPEASFYTNGR